MTLSPGSTLGRYEILAPAGAGGMGEVYRARDSRLDRTVAIKVLPADVAADPGWQARFEREARSVSALNHPRICSLYDAGEEAGTHFLVMEYLEGETLAERLARGALPVAEALDFGSQIADALATAHRAGVIHRDLKPGNVMLTKTGAKLLDFGLAKPVEPAAAALTVAPTATSPLTAMGTVVGTFQYMSPEVLEGGEADARSDLFAFGAMLYEMLTGRAAFAGKTQASVVAGVLKEETPAPSALQPEVPPALDRLVSRCLAKDPDERWQNATDLAGELSWIATGGGELPTASRSGRSSSPSSPWPWALAAGFALLAAILTILLWQRSEDEESPARAVRFEVEAPEGTRLRSMFEDAAPVAVSPDGRRIVFGVNEPDGSNRLWIRSLDDAVSRPLPGADGGMRPFWSPDGRSVGFFTTQELRRVDVDGAPPQTICSIRGARGGTWNVDDTIVFAPGSSTAQSRVPASGGEPEPATTLSRDEGESSHRYPEFLPDGRHFTFLALVGEGATGTGSESGNRLMLGSLDGAPPKVLMDGASQASFASGHLVFRRGQALQAQRFDLDRLELVGEPIALSEAVHYDASYERAIFSASGDVLAFVAGAFRGDTQMQLRDRSGAVLRTLLGDAEEMRFSPDGRRIATRTADDQGEAIRVVDLESGAVRRLTFGEGLQLAPVWSPDGQRIAYVAASGGESRLEVVRSDGDGAPEVLLERGDDLPLPFEWTRDGRSLLLGGEGEVSSDVWLLDLESGEPPRPLLDSPRHNESFPAVSPDGKWLAYTSDENGRPEVYLTRFPSTEGKWPISIAGGLEPRWNPVGGTLLFRDLGFGLIEVPIDLGGDAPEVGAPVRLFPAATAVDLQIGLFDVSPDGETFVVSVLPDEAIRAPITVVVDWAAELR